MGSGIAPGKKHRHRKSGLVYYWVASAIARDTKGFTPKTVQLHGNDEQMANRCRILTAELKEWISGRQGNLPKAFDGTIGGLIDLYIRTPQSSYGSIKYSTKLSYDWYLKMINASVGKRHLSQLNGLDFMRWYDNWRKPKKVGKDERIRRAYGAIQLLRVLFKFGIIVDVPECTRLTTILSTLRFQTCSPRTEFLTFEQCKAICDKP